MARLLAWFVLVSVSLAPPAAAAVTWTSFTSPDGRFRIELPAPPTGDAEDYDGDTKIHVMTVDLGPTGLYRVTTADHPPGFGDERPKQERLQILQDNIVRDLAGAQLLESASVTQGRWPGRAFSMSVDGGKLIHRLRLFLVGDRVYKIAAVSGAQRGSDPVAARFLNSFKILKAK